MKFDYPRPLYFAHQDYDVACGGNEIPMSHKTAKPTFMSSTRKTGGMSITALKMTGFILKKRSLNYSPHTKTKTA